MQEELDQLVARIGQLARYTERLKAERSVALDREAAAVRANGQLQAQLAQQREQAETLQQLLDECEASRLVLQQDVHAATAGLRADVERMAEENQQLRSTLTIRDGQLARLQQVATNAQQRIDAVLERLPGGLVAAEPDATEVQ